MTDQSRTSRFLSMLVLSLALTPPVAAQIVTGSEEMSITVAGQATGMFEGELINLSSVPTNFSVSSNTLQIASDVPDSPFTLTGSGSPQLSINGGAWVTSGTVTGGDEIRLRQTTSGILSTARTAELSVDGSSVTWSVTTGVSSACTLSQSFAGAGAIWGFYPNDRVSLGVSGYGVRRLSNMSGTSGVSTSGPSSWTGDISSFCGWTDSVPVEIKSFTATGALEDTARIRINEGPEVTSGMFAPGDKLQIVFTTSPQFSGSNSFQLTLNGGSGAYSYSHSNVSQVPSVISPPTMSFTSIPKLSLALAYGDVTAANSATVTSSAWVVPSLSVSKDQWYPAGLPYFTVESNNFPTTGRAFVNINSSLTSASAFNVLLRRGTTSISNGTEVFAGNSLTIRLTTPSSGSGLIRRRFALQETVGGITTVDASHWQVTFPIPPLPASFDAVTGAVGYTLYTSNTLTVSGITAFGGCNTASVTATSGVTNTAALVNGVAVSFPSSFSLCNGNTIALRTRTPIGSLWAAQTLTLTPYTGKTVTWCRVDLNCGSLRVGRCFVMCIDLKYESRMRRGLLVAVCLRSKRLATCDRKCPHSGQQMRPFAVGFKKVGPSKILHFVALGLQGP